MTVTIKKSNLYLAFVLIAVLFAWNVYKQFSLGDKKHIYINPSDDQKITQIEAYLDGVSSSLIDDTKKLAKKYNIPSWGCGPTSFALAKLINNKFFDDKLPFGAAYDNNEYEIVERFGLVQFDDNKGHKTVGDHAWIEIYLRDKILFIDPTIAQYGVAHGIVYGVYDVGLSDLKSDLKNKYNILDNRISKLVKKAQDKIPVDESPYPGLAIDPAYMDYFLRVSAERDTVNIGREPESWKPWVSQLLAKYQ